jgi:hypothetical protein
MRTKLISLFIVIILFVSNSLQASSKIHLKLNLKKGSVYEVTTILNNTTDQDLMGKKTKVDQKMETCFSFKVVDVLSNKDYAIDFSILKMKMNVNMDGKKANYDSESSNGNNPMNKTLKNLPSVKIELSPMGKIVSMEPYNLKSIVGEPEIVALMHTFLGNKRLESFIGQFFNYLTENKIGKGEKWTNNVKLPTVMNMEVPMNFEVADVQKNLISLNMSSDVNTETPIEPGGTKIDVKMIGKQDGTMTIDPSDGWLRSSNLNQKFNLKMKMKDPKTKEDTEAPSTSNSVIKITVVKK